MKRPKTCNGCKALYQSLYRFSCDLGYEINVRSTGKIRGADLYTVSPKCGECPKPLTYDELFQATKGATNV